MEYHSQDLATTVKVTNARSQNFYADTLLKYLGARRFGQGSFENGIAAVRDILRDRGLLSDTVVIDDGCGLSHANRVTPRAMTAVLRQVLLRPDAGVFVQSLARSGVDGTLRKRMTAAATRGRVLGKTGYVAGVSCLSGYVLDRTGQCALAYAILVNRTRSAWRAKQLQDGICAALVQAVGN